MPDWLRVLGNALVLTVHVQPGARSTEIVGGDGGALKIRLAARPVDGRANDELTALLARRLGVARSAIELKRGHGARQKQILVHGVEADEVACRLLPS